MRKFEVELVLTGAFTGQSKSVRGMQFTNGTAKFSGTREEVNGRVLYMGRCYKAFPKGSPELAQAQAIYKEYQDGIRSEVRPPAASRHPNEILNRPTESNGVESQSLLTEAKTLHGRADAGAESGSDVGNQSGAAGLLPSGGGQGDAGLHPGQPETDAAQPAASENLILDAVLKLDPDNDEHWTADGLPAILAVSELTGNNKLTRGDIEAAVGGDYFRDEAQIVKQDEFLKNLA